MIGLLEDLGEPSPAMLKKLTLTPQRSGTSQTSQTSSGADEPPGTDPASPNEASSPTDDTGGNDAAPARIPSVTVVMRDFSGTYSWSMQLRYLPNATAASAPTTMQRSVARGARTRSRSRRKG